jgi:hypothetical protein
MFLKANLHQFEDALSNKRRVINNLFEFCALGGIIDLL